MKWVTLIYLMAIVTYNLIGDNSHLYWVIHYYFFVHLMLTTAFFELWKKEALPGKRRLYFIGGCFSLFYTIFQVIALISGSIYKFLSMIDSPLWSAISAVILLILSIGYFYDTKARNSRN